MATSRPALRKAVFVKVDALKPGTQGHNVVVKVVSSEEVLKKGQSKIPSLRKTRVSECLVGDETASILFTARNDQGMYTHYSLFIYLCLYVLLFGFV